MNDELRRLAHEVGLDKPQAAHWRMTLGLVFASRVAHLLESESVISVLARAQAAVEQRDAAPAWAALAAEAAQLAQSHAGSKSIDGAAHAAVSATYAVAAAIAGRALDAADYAAYASVYSYAASAVSEPQAYREEHAWQVGALRALVAQNLV
jgi:hypothetical protein